MHKMSITITTRVDKETLKQIDEFSKHKKMDRATMLRNLIEDGLENERRERVINLYRERKVSMEKAAEMLKIDLWSFIDIIKSERLFLDYSEEELKDDLNGLRP